MLTKAQLDEITRLQKEKMSRFRAIPDGGQIVEYLGKEFIVYKNVFWPSDDSKPLVENYKINPGDEVLDVCTGSGVIAVFSAYKGAKKVVALDISADAVKTAKENAKRHGFENAIDVRLSDMFDTLKDDEKFDVITGNLPFKNMVAHDAAEATMWDTNLKIQKTFFNNIHKYLKPNGRIYITQSNYGAVEDMKRTAKTSGFDVLLIGEKNMSNNDPRVFYAFSISPSSN